MMIPHSSSIGEEPSSLQVVELITDQVRRDPGATAVVCADRRLTYRQLDTLSSQVARHIRSLGVREQTPVAVCLPRGVDAIVVLLAVLRAGAFFVPLDPGHPAQRLALTIETTRAPVLLTDRPESWSGRLTGVHVVAVDPLLANNQSCQERSCAISDAGLACVIYTSGSTGQPKGVMIEHGALGHHISAMCRLYELRPGDRVLQHSSLAFDTSLEAIFCGFAAGAELVVAPDLLSPLEMIEMIGRYGITWVELIPAYWAQLVDILPGLAESALGSLRMLVLGADVVPAGTLEKFLTVRPGIKVLNTYGPTEATIGCTAFHVPPDWRGSTVPIGKPCVPAKQVYIMDSGLGAVPDGEIGEICVAGAVARGYLNDPVLTAERFITWQRSPQGPPVRLYRTGDRGSKRTDGTIEFYGRMDRQVKVHGTRVEPGEIEGVLSRHPAVLGAAVVPVTDATDRRLVAYVQWANGAGESTDDLRAFAREHLAAAMLPTSWVSVNSIPTTVAGKVDLTALSGLTPVEADQQQVSEDADTTELEEAITRIWRDVLSVPVVFLDDNFFDLGGHSLSAMVLVFRLTEEFSVEVPLTSAFLYPTPRDMAEFIGQILCEEDEMETEDGFAEGPESSDQ
jgi:amino acid adenylation domain-containing protein